MSGATVMLRGSFLLLGALTVGCLCLVEDHSQPKFDPFVLPADDDGGVKEKQVLAGEEVPERKKRLPAVLEAKHYFIRIKPYFPTPGVEIPAEKCERNPEVQSSRDEKSRNMTFDGVTSFLFTVSKPTDSFTLHAHKLTFDKVILTDIDGISLGVTSTTVNASYDHVTVVPAETPVVGKTYLLQFKYRGIINQYATGGLFYTYYDDLQNNRHNGDPLIDSSNMVTAVKNGTIGGYECPTMRTPQATGVLVAIQQPSLIAGPMFYDVAHSLSSFMVATHMETGVHARAMYPCLDEPAYKAVFHISIIHPNRLVALSNTMERPQVDLGGGWALTRYPPSPKMSSYLTAIAVGPFVSRSTHDKNGVLIRIWSWTGQEKYLDFAAETSAKCLYSMGEFTDFKYPLEKSDQLGIPEFPAGAMENWGLIIYKYEYISFNPEVHTTQVKEKAAGVICHELAHQWFGDLVTAKWWTDLVVNEGFANYFMIYNQARALPAQERFLDAKFLIEMTERALDMDSEAASTHPIIDKDPNFDAIVYDKGAAMYRMTHLTLGDDVWQEGLRDYIHTYQYANADHEKLFAKLTTAAQRHKMIDWCGRPLDVAKFLDPWFLQQCFPLLSVTNNQLTGEPVITQQPYNEIKIMPPSPYNYSWPVPLFYRNYVNYTMNFEWLKPAYDQCGGAAVGKKTHTLNELSTPNGRSIHWELDNLRLTAFARTQYDDVGYARLIEDLKAHRHHDFWASDRIGLLGDEIAFLSRRKSERKPFSYNRIIELMSIILPNAPFFGTFKVSQSMIDHLERMFVDGLDYGLFKRFINAVLLDNYNALGWKPTGFWDNDMARFLMMPYVARYGLGDSAQKAIRMFDQFKTDCGTTATVVDTCSHIHPDVREAVYCAAVRYGPRENFKFLMKMYDLQYKNQFYFYQEYQAMLAGMACTQSVDDLNLLIPVLLDTTAPGASKAKPLMYLTRNPLASDVMMQYIRTRPNDVFGKANFELFLVAMTATWRTEARLKQFVALQNDLTARYPDLPTGLLTPSLIALKAQVAWSTQYFPDIVHIFYDRFVKSGDDPWDARLPKDLVPLKYKAFVQPYFPSSGKYEWYKNMTFDSIVNVTISVVTATDKIKISVHRLLIEPADVRLMNSANQPIEYAKIVKDYENGMMTIQLKAPLAAGTTFTLYIKSIGFIFYGAHDGVYTNFNYYEFNDKMAWILTTDMESGPEVRSLFPCFDEPFFKATWQLTIKHAADMKAMSNTIHTDVIIERDINDFGWSTTSFGETPKMSTYILAFAVGHFASMQKMSDTGVLVRVWAWTGMEQYAEMGLNFAAGAIDYMAKFLDIPFELPKLDLVAVPQYTGGSRAMENWGLIMMIYEAVLIDPLYATTLDYSVVARVTPHEVVHQWFGDLVTTDWWSTIFLNEAFAQYYYTDAANSTYPQQEKYARFVRFWLADYALQHDGDIKETRPIITDRKPIFTYAPYYKGASVLYMLNNAITEPIMQEGLRAYFKANAKKTTTEDILWAAITKATKEHQVEGWDNTLLNVQSLMDPWTKQENFPVLKLTTRNNMVTYTQEPFISNLTALPASPYKYVWPIPVHTLTSSGESLKYFTGDHEWTLPADASWRVENPGSVGTYRVWYDEASWAPIREQLKTDLTAFDELTRAQFISDAFALRQRGSLSWSRVLEFVVPMSNETDFATHFAFQRLRDELSRAFKGTSDMPIIKKFIQRSFETAYNKVGWASNTDWADAATATLATDGMCKTGQAACLAETKKLFSNFLTNCEYSTTGTGLCNSAVRPDVRRTQYCYGLAQSSQGYTLVSKLYDWFTNNSRYFHRDADNLLNAMACTKDASLMDNLIAETLAGKYPETVLEHIAAHDETDRILYNYFLKHVEDVVYGVPSFTTYMTTAIGTWNDEQRIVELNDFLGSPAAMPLNKDEWDVMQDLKDTIRSNIAWLTKNRADIIPYMQKVLA